ncbi:MAG: shikimate dehydrogenase [Bacteroidales bacterium]|jgi:shikimate dehydrogenase
MRKFGLIGYPLGHSFSKNYFTEKFAKEGINDAVYENYPLENIELLPLLIRETDSLAGLNVTIPHKTNVIRFLSETDSEAKAAGAVNVIKIVRENGVNRLKGYNTDIYGFRESLLPELKADKYSALILGTGGSSLAVRYVLTSLGINYISVSRTPSEVNIAYADLTDEIIKENNLIINTTPLGMFPNIKSYPDINYNALTERHILYDLVYNPGLTKFLAKGKERGCTVTGGLKMLYLQAERSWNIWNDPGI